MYLVLILGFFGVVNSLTYGSFLYVYTNKVYTDHFRMLRTSFR